MGAQVHATLATCLNPSARPNQMSAKIKKYVFTLGGFGTKMIGTQKMHVQKWNKKMQKRM